MRRTVPQIDYIDKVPYRVADTRGTVNGKDTGVEGRGGPWTYAHVCGAPPRAWIGPKVVMGKVSRDCAQLRDNIANSRTTNISRISLRVAGIFADVGQIRSDWNVKKPVSSLQNRDTAALKCIRSQKNVRSAAARGPTGTNI
ncbi:Uncharacterized protein DBV15_00576 [Temnothorax longispinosus]|uniref:Uncharacterized protein n=1 Tax=Temnothorax longispinosus TaxID=300112 RepID=A0A4S2KXV5_9HYME|nr:Uncharacterized protein DBV15_00576 [Temnothorax longispinosus]